MIERPRESPGKLRFARDQRAAPDRRAILQRDERAPCHRCPPLDELLQFSHVAQDSSTAAAAAAGIVEAGVSDHVWSLEEIAELAN